MAITVKKLSLALAALTTPTFNYQVTMPSFKIGTVAVTASGTEMNFLVGVSSAIQAQIDAKLASTSYTAADVLTKLLTVDGTGSGLDADLLDGHDSTYFHVANADSTGAAASLKTTDFVFAQIGTNLVLSYQGATILEITNTGAIVSEAEGSFFTNVP
jgi:hypothetical protein